MAQESIQNAARYVVSDTHHGSILPAAMQEMGRSVFLLNGAKVLGSVWANELSVTGPDVSVEESVFAKGAVTLKKPEKNDPAASVTFGSTFTTQDSLMMESGAGRTRFLSDIYAGKIKLRNSFILGNVYASNAVLENCIVIGGLYVNNRLTLHNSVISTFKAGSVEFGSNVYMLIPAAISDEPITIEHPVKAITFYQLLGENSNAVEQGIITLTQDDVFELEAASEEEKELIAQTYGASAGRYCISAAERILGAQRIAGHFKKNIDFFQHLALMGHIDPEKRLEEFDKPLEKLEIAIWKFLKNGENVPELEGYEYLQDLYTRFEN